MRTRRASPWRGPVSVTVHPGRLRFEIVRRGWSASDLAREARLSPATISAALGGRPIAAKSLDLIGDAFTRVAAKKAIDELIMGEPFDLGQ